MIMYGGSSEDMIATAFAGGLGYSCYYLINNQLKIRFVSEFLASFLIGVIAVFFVHVHLGIQIGMITIGGVMPLVPGVPITNAVRDVFAGHF